MELSGFREKLAASKMEPDMLTTCLSITDVLYKVPLGDGQHLGLPFFYERITDAVMQKNLLSALSILSTLDGAILKMHCYLDDDLDGQLHLSDDELKELMQTGLLAHPNSGDLIPKPFNHVRIFYSLRDRMQNDS